MRARCGGGAAAWDTGVLAAPGAQGSWWLGQQEIYCSRRVWQPVLSNTLQYSCLENPLTDRPRRPQSTGLQRTGHDQSDPACIDARFVLFSFSFIFLCMTAVRVECEGGAAAWFAGTLAVQSVHGHRLPPTRSYGPFRVFFQASCSWQSEGLLASLSL